MTQIVTVNVSVTQAPKPNRLQQTGALISVGGTITPPYAHGGATGVAFLSQASDLTPLLTPPAANTSLTWSGGTVDVVTTAPHGLTIGDEVLVTIAGAVPIGYNVGRITATVTGASAFTYPLASNPGAESTPGTWVPFSWTEIQQMVATFFAQGGSIGVYLIELGLQQTSTIVANNTAEIAQLTAFINDNIDPQWIYAYLVPRDWSGNANLPILVADWEATTAKTYFFILATDGNYTLYTAAMKSAFLIIEAPTAASASVLPNAEFDTAAAMWNVLHQNPSSSNLATPLCYSFVQGVTAWPLPGNGPLLNTYALANVNVIGTGAEGGISNTLLLYGTTMDGNDFQFWYSVDWVQDQSDLQLANAVINGSNNPQAPLLYNQAGINYLQSVEVSVMKQAIGYGLAVGNLVTTTLPAAAFIENVTNGVYAGQVVVNADPFTSYTAENPDDYAAGKYGGLTVVYTPERGFRTIVLNVNATQFP